MLICQKQRTGVILAGGFYTTTIREQALQWGYNMVNRFGGEGVFLYEFEFSPSGSLKSKQFPDISDEWFDFILSNRVSDVLQHDFDYVQGPVANDKTVLTIVPSRIQRPKITKSHSHHSIRKAS